MFGIYLKSKSDPSYPQAVAVLTHNIWGGARPHGQRGSANVQRGSAAEPPAGSRGKAPGQGVRGESDLKLKHFWFSDVQ